MTQIEELVNYLNTTNRTAREIAQKVDVYRKASKGTVFILEEDLPVILEELL